MVIGVAQAITIVASLVSIPILARLLDQADFGLVALVTIVANFGAMFVDAGLSAATIQSPTITKEQSSNLFWVNSVIGFAITATLCIVSPSIAWFYHDPRLALIVCITSSSVFLSGICVQHQALLRRNLMFNRVAAVSVSSTVIGQASAIVLAYLWHDREYDYFSLVAIPVVTASVRVPILFCALPWVPQLFSRGHNTRNLVRFGTDLTTYRLLHYFAYNLDYVLLGYWWNETVVGVYERAFKLILFPVQRLNDPLVNVVTPALSRVAQDSAKWTSTFQQISRTLLFTVTPAIAMVASSAQWWVILILTEAYYDAVTLFRWLALVAIVQPVSNLFGPMFITSGRSREFKRLGYLTHPITICAFMLAAPFGAEAVAIAYALSGLFLRVPLAVWYLEHTKVFPSRLIIYEFAVALPLIIAVVVYNVGLSTIIGPSDTVKGVIASSVGSLITWLVFAIWYPPSRHVVALLRDTFVTAFKQVDRL